MCVAIIDANALGTVVCGGKGLSFDLEVTVASKVALFQTFSQKSDGR